MSFNRHGATWANGTSDLEVEMYCIRKGGRWKIGQKECGEGLPFHYLKMRQILWPWIQEHRWEVLCRESILSNKICVIAGCASSGKTFSASWIFLCEYFCFPEETCVLVSSTRIDGLRLRVWGEITRLWNEAVNRFPELPGHLIDSKLLLATDNLNEANIDEHRMARDWRKGIKGIPCVENTKFVGLSKFIGIKQKRMRLIADEAQDMPGSFLSAFSNLDKNEDFRAVVLGNPREVTDSLGRAAEPADGWTTHLKPEKTVTWKTKFFSGLCVNLVGTDSPNFDYPPDESTRFPFLNSREKIERTLTAFAKDSHEYYSQCVGIFNVSTLDRHVVTRDLCFKFGATKDVTWMNTDLTRICALDAAYGGDRCIAGHADFGKDVDGNLILKIFEPVDIPVLVRPDMSAEDQISTYIKNYASNHSIKPENFFHDSTGRGSLGTSLARIWSNLCNPVEFGGRPTKRPVSLDILIDDPETNMRRPKRCDEHYDRFVTELWFSIRYTIEAGQMRNLPSEVMNELVMRKWDKIRGDLYSVEPKSGTLTKPGFKQRVGFSPDLADWLSIIVEGARQRGFEIKKLGGAREEESGDDFFKLEAERYAKAIKANLLSHA